MDKRSILVVATSPPPYGGQALMVQSLMEAEFQTVDLYHVRMAFSSSMASVGRFEWHKLLHMVHIVWQAAVERFRHGVHVLYYVPGGSGAVPVVRDVFILFFLRPLFKKVIFHYHAAGVSLVVQRLPWLLRTLAKRLYSYSDLSIFLSERNPDHLYFRSKRYLVAPNGLHDEAIAYLPFSRPPAVVTTILFAGVLQRSKGVMVLLEAIRILKYQGHAVRGVIMGEFSSDEFKMEVLDFCKRHVLEETVVFTGVKTGSEKWNHFAAADIFCFPSFFESESFGNVVVEAMMFELPVVATAWRGIPDIVQENETGLLVPVQDHVSLVAALEKLIANPFLRTWMGKNGRTRYLEKYQWQKFKKVLDEAFHEVAYA